MATHGIVKKSMIRLEVAYFISTWLRKNFDRSITRVFTLSHFQKTVFYSQKFSLMWKNLFLQIKENFFDWKKTAKASNIDLSTYTIKSNLLNIERRILFKIDINSGVNPPCFSKEKFLIANMQYKTFPIILIVSLCCISFKLELQDVIIQSWMEK